MITIARNVRMEFRRGAGSSLEVLYGKVTLTPTNLHTVGTSTVLPAPSTFDLINGVAIATNVAPSPAPVGGQVDWAYTFRITDNFGKTWEYMAGVPDGTTEINFNVLPRYFATKPPLFGQGPQGVPGEAAIIEIGSVGATPPGSEPVVTNSGTANEAVLNFELPRGEEGPRGAGVPAGGSALQIIRKDAANATTEWATLDKALLGLGNVDNTSDANKPVSTAQKSYVDLSNTLPARAKTSADPPSSYPSGVTATIVSPVEGWPGTAGGETNVLQAVTSKNPSNFGAITQWLSPFNDPTQPLQYRVSKPDDSWGEFYGVATTDSAESRGSLGVAAKDYGFPGVIVGDGINNDYWTIQRALNAAKGKDVILEGGLTYRMAGTLTVPAGTDSVSIRAMGSKPAELHLGADGQSYSAIKFEQTTSSATTTLAASIGIGTVGWPVADTAGIEPGMICEVVSTKPWYFDPRPESSDARKSELHRVRGTFLGKVYFDDPANDGYDVAAETVTLTFFRPIKVRLENIKVVGILPDVAEETKAVIGLEIQHADEPELINVSVENCARTGIRTFLCYRPKITGGYTARANNYYNGYGVSIDGCAHAIVRDHITFECRRSTDVTGQTVASRISSFINCTAVGGGKNSRGDNYGWNEDGSVGVYQGAFGSHGPSDQTRYINCTSIRTQRSYTLLGRDEMIINMRHIGRSFGGVISCTAGTNLLVLGGWATSGYHSYKHQKSHLTGPNSSINTHRPDYFIRFYPEYQMNTPYAEQHGRVILKGVTAECQGRAIFFDGHAPKGHFVVADNDWMLASAVGTDAVAMMVHQGVPEVYNKNKWFIGPNRITRDTGSGPIQIANNISLEGANVLNYTVST